MTSHVSTFDVLIIGGGLHGCSSALQLALQGMRVGVLEKDHVARHASGVNAGGVRRLGRHVAEVPLSVASMEMWRHIEDLVGDDCGFESHGQVKVAESEEDLTLLRERAQRLQGLGFHHEEVIDRQELREILPAVSPHCVGGLISRADGAALPYRTTLAFKRAGERAGVRYFEGLSAQSLTRAGGVWQVGTAQGHFEAPWVVNAAGAWGAKVAEWVGEVAPVKPSAYMLMITARTAPFVKPVVGATQRTLSFKQFANGTVLIGGGHLGRAWPQSNRTDLDFTKLALNARIAAEIFPCMRDVSVVRAWAGIEGRMPDDIPVLGLSAQAPGLVHSFGYSGHGFQLGPICGTIVADLVLRGRSHFDLSAFDIRRFSATPQQM